MEQFINPLREVIERWNAFIVWCRSLAVRFIATIITSGWLVLSIVFAGATLIALESFSSAHNP